CGTADDTSVCADLEAIVDVHHRRWRAKQDDDGMLAGEQMEAFHRRAALELYQRGVARFRALRHDGRIIASVYALLENRRAYSYLGGFDPALSAFSPGSLILEYAIARSIEEGATEFDFLRGEE